MRLTEKDQMGNYGYFTYKTDEIEIVNKLGQLEDILEILKNKNAYLCFIDNVWCICNMENDTILEEVSI